MKTGWLVIEAEYHWANCALVGVFLDEAAADAYAAEKRKAWAEKNSEGLDYTLSNDNNSFEICEVDIFEAGEMPPEQEEAPEAV